MNFQEPLSGLFERIARAIERLVRASPSRPISPQATPLSGKPRRSVSCLLAANDLKQTFTLQPETSRSPAR